MRMENNSEVLPTEQKKSRIRDFRLKLNLTQQSFAQKIGVAVATVYRWESGKINPSHLALQTLIRLGYSK